MAACPFCGEDLDDGAPQCGHCGSRRDSPQLPTDEERAASREALRRHAKRLAWVFGALGLTCFALAAAGLTWRGAWDGELLVDLGAFPKRAVSGPDGKLVVDVSAGLTAGPTGRLRVDPACDFFFRWDDYHEQPRALVRIIDQAADPEDDPERTAVAGLERVRVVDGFVPVATLYASVDPGLGRPTYLGFKPRAPRPGFLSGTTRVWSSFDYAWSAGFMGVPVLAGAFFALVGLVVPLCVLAGEAALRRRGGAASPA